MYALRGVLNGGYVIIQKNPKNGSIREAIGTSLISPINQFAIKYKSIDLSQIISLRSFSTKYDKLINKLIEGDILLLKNTKQFTPIEKAAFLKLGFEIRAINVKPQVIGKGDTAKKSNELVSNYYIAELKFLGRNKANLHDINKLWLKNHYLPEDTFEKGRAKIERLMKEWYEEVEYITKEKGEDLLIKTLNKLKPIGERVKPKEATEDLSEEIYIDFLDYLTKEKLRRANLAALEELSEEITKTIEDAKINHFNKRRYINKVRRIERIMKRRWEELEQENEEKVLSTLASIKPLAKKFGYGDYSEELIDIALYIHMLDHVDELMERETELALIDEIKADIKKISKTVKESIKYWNLINKAERTLKQHNLLSEEDKELIEKAKAFNSWRKGNSERKKRKHKIDA